MNQPDLPGIIWFMFTAFSAGFVWLIWRIIKQVIDDTTFIRKDLQELRNDIAKAREDMLTNCNKCSEKFRTKTESETDWRKLNDSMAEIKALAAERHKQIWEKIDNQTRLFMQEKQYLNDLLNKSTERITRLEIENGK